MIIVNMQASSFKSLSPRLTAWLMGLLVAGSVVYWVLRWPVPDAVRLAPVAANQEAGVAVEPVMLSRLLGAQGTPVGKATAIEPDSRFRLVGVIASGSGQGVALLSIDGKPAKPYPVGSTLEDGLVVQSVEARRAALARDAKAPVQTWLELQRKQP